MKNLLKELVEDRSQIIDCEDMNFRPLYDDDNNGGYFCNSNLIDKFSDEFRAHRAGRYDLKMDFMGQK